MDRVWRSSLVLALVLGTAGCADTGSGTLPSPPAAAPGSHCTPAPDPLAFQITYRLLPSGRRLQRPFMATEPGRIYVAANTLEANGTPRETGAVWVAKDAEGDGLSSVNDVARAESDLPDARTAFPGAETSPVLAALLACVQTG